MLKKKGAIRKANVIREEVDEVEEEEEEKELPKLEDQKKPEVLQVPVFLTQADLNKMVYNNHLMLREILKYCKEE